MTQEPINLKQWRAKLTELRSRLETECPHVQIQQVGGSILDLRCDGFRGNVGINFIIEPGDVDFEVMRAQVAFSDVDDLCGLFSQSKITAFTLLADALRICDDVVHGIYVNIKESNS